MSHPPIIKILHLEDEELYHDVVRATLSKASFGVEMKVVDTRQDFAAALTSFNPDIILADYVLPTFSGVEALSLARALVPAVPFIFLSGALGEENAIEMLRLGATDYVLKNRLGRLSPAIQRALREAETARERTRAEQALRESERTFRELFTRLNDIVIVYELDEKGRPGNIIEVNPRATAILGYTPAELVGMERLKLTPPDYHDRIIRALCEVMEKGMDRYESMFLTKDGRVLSCEVVAHTFIFKGKTVVLAQARDMSDQKRAEENLRNSERRFAAIFRGSPAPIGIGTIATGKLIDVNERYAEFFGYTREEMIGKTVGELGLWARPDDRKAVIEQLMAQGYVRAVGAEFRRKSGELRHALLSMEILTLPHAEPVLIAMLADITERKAAEEELKRSSEQLRAYAARVQTIREQERAAIAREIHDELGQMLTVLHMELASLESALQKNAPALLPATRSMASLIMDSINSVRKIATELHPPLLDDLGLSEAIEWQAERFSEQSGIRCDYHPPQSDVPLDIDRTTALFRICQEALTNVMRHAEASHVHIALSFDNDAVELTIRDNGRGITQEEIEGMHSLGLLGMRERAAIFEGTVQISGKAGEGSTLRARIPLAPRAE